MKLMDKLIEMDAGRMKSWAWIAAATSLCLLAFYPQQIPTLLAKINLLAIAAWGGYWIDRAAFPYARPGALSDGDRNSAGMRRAVVIAGAMLSMALAL